MASLLTVHSPPHVPTNRRAPADVACRVCVSRRTLRTTAHSPADVCGLNRRAAALNTRCHRVEGISSVTTCIRCPLYHKKRVQTVLSKFWPPGGDPRNPRPAGVGQGLLSMPTARDVNIPPGRVEGARGIGPGPSVLSRTDVPAQISKKSK